MGQNYADAVRKVLSDNTLMIKDHSTGKDAAKVTSSGKVMKVGGMFEGSTHIGDIANKGDYFEVNAKTKSGTQSLGRLDVERKGVVNNYGVAVAKYESSGDIRSKSDHVVAKTSYGSDKIKGSIQAAAGLIYARHLEDNLNK